MTNRTKRIPFSSCGIRRIPSIYKRVGLDSNFRAADINIPIWPGWGNKRSFIAAKFCARLLGGTAVHLEDSFLRSLKPGPNCPSIGLVCDLNGIYYDASEESDLERLLNKPGNLPEAALESGQTAISSILSDDLSKYNQRARENVELPQSPCVLLVDQTYNDLSISAGMANKDDFERMLIAASEEYPQSTLLIKTHPEVISGKKKGYLSHIPPKLTARCKFISEQVPLNTLMAAVEHVYVVTSTLGFEALLRGKAVTCFGMPWYAGWGCTDDRKSPPRPRRNRSTLELFTAAYVMYCYYWNPDLDMPGDIHSAIDWLCRQKLTSSTGTNRRIVVGMRRWKAGNLRPILEHGCDTLLYVAEVGEAAKLNPDKHDELLCWGAFEPKGLAELANTTGATITRIEDGFVRSVGLGSDLIPPQSIVLDRSGLYFDPTRSSDLETILNRIELTEENLHTSQRIQRLINERELTKYNIDPLTDVGWKHKAGGESGPEVILVPGQVEDDASIRLGCSEVADNITLLKSVRETAPEAYIVYKPHPDVLARNRIGRLHEQQARRFCDHIETQASIVSCINACDHLHTMTSLSGFDALLRNKKVTTWGSPFYAGWGLTDDRHLLPAAASRRTAKLSLNELVYGCLHEYPFYWNPQFKGISTCEATLMKIANERDRLTKTGKLGRLRNGWLRRLARKISILLKNGIRFH